MMCFRNMIHLIVAAKMVAEHHFGGFMKKKWEPPGSEGTIKSWKERMEEVISQSKKAKVLFRLKSNN